MARRTVGQALPREHVDCAFLPCQRSAVMRLRRPTGWANVCRVHAEGIWQREADGFVAEQGLTSLAAKQEWVRAKLASSKPHPKQWAHDLLARRDRGENLLPIQIELAERAIQREKMADRIPGSDDEAPA